MYDGVPVKEPNTNPRTVRESLIQFLLSVETTANWDLNAKQYRAWGSVLSR